MSGAIAGAAIGASAALGAVSAHKQRKQAQEAASKAEMMQMLSLMQQQQAFTKQQESASKQIEAQKQQVEAMETANSLQAQSIANAQQETNRANALTARPTDSDTPKDMRTNFTGGQGVNQSQYLLGNNNLLGFNDEDENEESDVVPASGGSLFG